jgi:hypothetical protein
MAEVHVGRPLPHFGSSNDVLYIAVVGNPIKAFLANMAKVGFKPLQTIQALRADKVILQSCPGESLRIRGIFCREQVKADTPVGWRVHMRAFDGSHGQSSFYLARRGFTPPPG